MDNRKRINKILTLLPKAFGLATYGVPNMLTVRGSILCTGSFTHPFGHPSGGSPRLLHHGGTTQGPKTLVKPPKILLFIKHEKSRTRFKHHSNPHRIALLWEML